jgi:protein-tyrosine phosphatase
LHGHTWQADHVPAHRQTSIRVCFICTGNICRSPMAEKVFIEHLRRARLDHRVRVSSAGTGGWHVGDPADPRTEDVLRRHGYPIDHKARQVAVEHTDADLLVALDSGHARSLRRIVDHPDRIRLLRSFDPDAGADLDVPDPYYGGRPGFDEVLTMIEAAMPGLLAWVRERL